MPNGERFFRQSRRIFADGLPPVKDNNDAMRKFRPGYDLISGRMDHWYLPLTVHSILQISPKNKRSESPDAKNRQKIKIGASYKNLLSGGPDFDAVVPPPQRTANPAENVFDRRTNGGL
jgi:hypothetical protein